MFQLRLFILLMAVLVLSWMFFGCGQQPKDITYTTKSAEAKKYFMEGLEKFDDFHSDEARELFGKAVETDPEFAMGYYFWAFTATTAADFQKRLNKAAKLVENVTEPEKLIISSAKAANEDNAGLARERLEQMVKLLPEGKRAHYILGIFYFGQQEWASAEKELQTTISLDPQFAPAYNNLGYLLSNLNRYPEAIEALKKYAELRPEDPNPHDSMGEIYLWLGDHKNSINEYSNSLKLDPDFVISLAGIGHNYVFMGEFDKARAKYNEMAKHAQSVADTNATYLWKAVSYIHENIYDKAIVVLKEQLDFAKARDDIFIQATKYNQIAAILYEKGDLMRALSEISQARELTTQMEPGVREGYIRFSAFNEAVILNRQKKQEMAKARIEEFKKSAEDSENPVVMNNYHSLLGITAYWNKDYQTAIDELKQANPLDQYSKYYLGLCYEKTGQEQEAKKVFSEVAGFNRNNIFYAFVRPAAIKKM